MFVLSFNKFTYWKRKTLYDMSFLYFLKHENIKNKLNLNSYRCILTIHWAAIMDMLFKLLSLVSWSATLLNLYNCISTSHVKYPKHFWLHFQIFDLSVSFIWIYNTMHISVFYLIKSIDKRFLLVWIYGLRQFILVKFT